MTADGDTAFVATYTPANDTVDTTTYKLDTTTGVEITNQLDHANGGLQYLSRSDWTGTWPTVDGEVSDQISTWATPSMVPMSAARLHPIPTARRSARRNLQSWILLIP